MFAVHMAIAERVLVTIGDPSRSAKQDGIGSRSVRFLEGKVLNASCNAEC